MTIQQISKLYGYSITSIQRNFKRTAAAIKKKYGVDLIKCESATVGVFYQISLPRALTMYQEMKNELYIPIETIKADDLACFVLIGIAATPQGIFRGSRKDFLDYIGLSHNKRNIDLLNEVLENFANKQGSPLVYQTDEDFIIVYIDRGFEQKQMLTISMLRGCQEIAQKYNKQAMKVIQLLKVWQAYRINEWKGVNPLTDKDLQKYIDLSPKQIRDARKLLEQEGIINVQRVGTADIRLGSSFSTTAFYDGGGDVLIKN